jgi:hypothetical protein
MDELQSRFEGCRSPIAGCIWAVGRLIDSSLNSFVPTVERSRGCPVPLLRLLNCLHGYVIYESLHSSDNCAVTVTLASNVGSSHIPAPTEMLA